MSTTIHIAGPGLTVSLRPSGPLNARGRNGWFAVARIRVQPEILHPGQARLEVYSRRPTYPPPILVELDQPAARAVAVALLQAAGIDLAAAFADLRTAQAAYGALCAQAERGALHAYRETDERPSAPATDAAHDATRILEQICSFIGSPDDTAV